MPSPCEPKQDGFVDAGRQAIDRNRNLWALVNERFTDTDADVRWTASGITWGLFQHREEELGLLGDVAALDVVELGCGTAYLAAALARRGPARSRWTSARRNSTPPVAASSATGPRSRSWRRTASGCR